MVDHVKTSPKKEFIIGTEKGLCYRLEKENPGKKFYPIPSAVCPNMKKTTLEKVLKSMETLEPKIQSLRIDHAESTGPITAYDGYEVR